MDFLMLVAAWVLVWGTIGALIAPRKGWTPGRGFAFSAVLGIFGIAFLALQPDVPTGTPPKGLPPLINIVLPDRNE